jgi:hypothetical protein
LLLAAVLIAAACSKKDNSTTASTRAPTTVSGSAACQEATANHGMVSGVPITYLAAKEGGCADKITWNDSCDATTGYIKMPLTTDQAIPCVAKQTASNGGATTPGVTATAIKIAYYVAPPDPSGDALLKQLGLYDTPAAAEQTVKDYVAIFNSVAEMYGRKVELVKLDGTGLSTDEAAARSDALKAKELGVFAVIGGPAQAKSFSEELAADHILCVGSCIVAQPQVYYQQNSPYLWPIGPSPDQGAAFNVEFVKKQLAGKDAQFAGDPKFQTRPRTFALLTYDTPDGQFASAWNTFESNLKAAVGPANYKGRVTYFLNVATAPQDGITIARKLKALGASTVVFTGDPLEPIYFTKEATNQGYFPEWVLAGTVFADTSSFGRFFDPKQWKHAFGESLIAPRIPREQSDAISLYKWAFHKDPAAANGAGIIYGNYNLLFTGLQLAGPNLTPQTFQQGLFGVPLRPRDPGHLQGTVSYGDHGLWPKGTDYAGEDDDNIVWWNPDGKGQDETGKAGTGIYMYVKDAARFRIGDIPTDPIGLFQPSGSVAYFTDDASQCNVCQPVPSALKYTGPTYPPPTLSG